MGFFFKDKEEEVAKPKVSEQKKTSSPSPTSFSNQGSVPTQITPVFAGGYNTGSSNQPIDPSKYDEYFKNLFKANNIDGPDYFEFYNAIESLKSSPIDERTKFITVFAGFQQQGVTFDKLIQTANNYKSIFNNKGEAFVNNLNAVIGGDIQRKESRCTELEKKNTDIDAQMALLSEQKIQNAKEISTLRQEVSNDNISLQSQKAGFENVQRRWVQEIENNVTKITSYLTPTGTV